MPCSARINGAGTEIFCGKSMRIYVFPPLLYPEPELAANPKPPEAVVLKVCWNAPTVENGRLEARAVRRGGSKDTIVALGRASAADHGVELV